MKTKSHEKHKHKKHKHKKEKLKKERQKTSSSSNSDSSESDEWVVSTEQKKEKREEWMNNDNDHFDDFVPTYSRGGGERKRQRLEKAEAQKLLEKKLLQERELNPYWKNDGCGLPMQKPGEDDEQSLKLPAQSVGDGGYTWLKKAHNRVREQAESEGRTMEQVAIERWGSLAKLESMLNDAKQRRSSSAQTSEKRYRDDYDKRNIQGPDEDSRDRSYSKHSDYKKHRKDDESHKSYKNSSKDSRRSRSSSPENFRSHHNQQYRRESSRESNHDGKRFLPPKDDHEERHPSWRKKYHEKESPSREKRTSSSREKRTSPSRESNYEGKRFLPSKEDRKEQHSASRKKSAERESPSLEKEYKFSSSVASKSHRSSESSHQPAWKKKSFVAESSLPEKSLAAESSLPGKSLAAEQTETEEESFKKTVPETENFKAEAKEVNKESVSSEEDSDTDHKAPKKDIVMNRNELNLLASRALRAEFWCDFQLAEQIQQDLDLAKTTRENFVKSGATIYDGQPREEVVASTVDCYRLPKKFKECGGKSIRRDKVVHVGSFKKQYFDDHLSLKEMFQNEKTSTADDQLKMYIETAASVKNSVSEDFADDLSGKISKKMDNYQSEEKDIKKAIQDHKRHSNALDRCRFCLDKPQLLKHTIVAKGEHVFICVPPFTSLTEGHCFIIPKVHVSSSLVLEENEFAELQLFKRGLSKIFFDKGHSLIFMETSINHRHFPHAVVECVPVPNDATEFAPMYFKKAIDECETEWAHNKKLIDLSKKDLRHSVPKGLQFFAVEFSFGGGFAHIVEDEKNFPKHFGKEIVGGMLEIDSYHILKAKDEPMKDVFRKVLKLTEDWWKYRNYFEY